MEQNDKWSQWNQNHFNDSVMKMGEIKSARIELENTKVKAEKQAANVMKVVAGKIYRRQSEGMSEPCFRRPAVRLRGRETSVSNGGLISSSAPNKTHFPAPRQYSTRLANLTAWHPYLEKASAWRKNA